MYKYVTIYKYTYIYICNFVYVCVILNLSTDDGDAVVPSLPKIPPYNNATGMITNNVLKFLLSH